MTKNFIPDTVCDYCEKQYDKGYEQGKKDERLRIYKLILDYGQLGIIFDNRNFEKEFFEKELMKNE